MQIKLSKLINFKISGYINTLQNMSKFLNEDEIKNQVLENERRLLEAIKNADFNQLDELLHDDLIFNIPTGQTITKELDIENYRSGIMKVDKITASNYVINTIENSATVSVIIHLKGSFANQNINGKYKYLRVWLNIQDSWKIISGSAIQVE